MRPIRTFFISALLSGIFGTNTWAADVELTRSCQEHLQVALTNNTLVVDSQLGLLSVEGYDTEKDQVTVRSRDVHRSYRPEKGRTKKQGMYSQAPFKLPVASTRALAEVGHRDATAIIHERTKRLLGIKRSGLFFAVMAMRSHSNASFLWRNVILNQAIEQLNHRRLHANKSPTSINEVLTADFVSQTDHRSHIAETVTEIIQLVHEISGENLVRSGILQNYAVGYHRNWTLSGNSEGNRGKISVRKPNGHLHDNFIPQDVDHYARSFLWNKSQQLFELRSALSLSPNVDQGLNSILHSSGASRLVFYDQPPELPLSLHRILMVKVEITPKKQDVWIPQPSPEARRWRRIYDASGTMDIEDPPAVDSHIVVMLTPSDISEYQREELLRKLYDHGAVRVIKVTYERNQ